MKKYILLTFCAIIFAYKAKAQTFEREYPFNILSIDLNMNGTIDRNETYKFDGSVKVEQQAASYGNKQTVIIPIGEKTVIITLLMAQYGEKDNACYTFNSDNKIAWMWMQHDDMGINTFTVKDTRNMVVR